MTPSRTSLPPLLGRAASGAVVGGALFTSERHRTVPGAAFGAAAAVAAAYAGSGCARREREDRAPDPVVALAEDTVVLVGSRRLLR